MKKGIKIALWSAGFIVLCTLITCKLLKNQETAKVEIEKELKPIPYGVIASYVKSENVNNAQTFRGSIEAKSIVQIFSEADGKIEKLYIEKGAIVVKGQELGTIDPTIRNASNQINAISITKANEDYNVAKKNYDRYQALLKENNASIVEVENAKQQLNATEIQLKTLEQQLAISKRQLQEVRFIAPINGIVIDKKVFNGDYVQPGTILGSIADLNTVIVKIYVPETFVINLKIGSSVKVNADVFPDIQFLGQIKNIIPVANEAKAYPIEIEIPNNNKSHLLFAGMSVTASFANTCNNKTFISIPRTALTTEKDKTFVFVILKNKKIEKRTITLGVNYGTQVQVLEGLQLGELVISNGQNNVEPGKVLANYTVSESK